MKTKIRTFQTVCILGFIALMNVNAVADNKSACNIEVALGTTEKVLVETSTANTSFFEYAEALMAKEADAQVAKFATKQIQHNENAIAKQKFSSLDEMQTSSESDLLIGKYATLQVELQKNRSEK